MEKTEILLTEELIMRRIFLVHGKKVMLDEHLADLYRVETKQLKRQVRRHLQRFPEDFMFELSKEEFENLRSQIGTSNWGGTRYLPMAFTEQGVAMLSSILNSERAISVNIQVIRIFTRIREMLLTHKDILLKIDEIEKIVVSHDNSIAVIFEYLKELLTPPNPPRARIGFIQ